MEAGGFEGQGGRLEIGEEPVPKEEGSPTGGDTGGGDAAVGICQVLWS